MYNIDFSKPEKVYFVGIGGISMSGLAEILNNAGFEVLGSDREASNITRGLEKKGIKVLYGQKAENITADINCVVFTSAIREDNPEYIETHRLGLNCLTRAELLGQLMRNYETSIAIAGTHGKTTTTSMVSEMLMAAKTDPTLSIGGVLKSIGGNVRVGARDIFVTEACEYTNSFLSFYPNVAVILNIEEDHLDFFKDIDDIRASFRRFAELLPENGALVINAAIDRYKEITDGLVCKVITFGLEEKDAYGEKVDYYPLNINYNEKGFAAFEVNGGSKIQLSVPGNHNIANALAAVAVGDIAGISREIACNAIGGFEGTDRRFELKGSFNGVTVIDDYAHHPTEIAATLNAAKRYPHERLFVAFQSHTYTRTKAFLNEFADSLSMADHVVLADIYAAREKDTLGISALDLKKLICENGVVCDYFPSFEEIENFLLENCREGDLLITMGAGDIYKVGEKLTKA